MHALGTAIKKLLGLATVLSTAKLLTHCLNTSFMNGHVCLEQIFLERYLSISKKKQQNLKKDNIKQKSTVKEQRKYFDSLS